MAREDPREGLAAECGNGERTRSIASGSQVSDSPYSLAASEEFQMVYHGGKRDDITVLLALIR